METIDLTPTWGEWGILYLRLAESGETDAIRHLRPDLMRVFALAEACAQISQTLTEEQSRAFAEAYAREMRKVERAFS